MPVSEECFHMLSSVMFWLSKQQGPIICFCKKVSTSVMEGESCGFAYTFCGRSEPHNLHFCFTRLQNRKPFLIGQTIHLRNSDSRLNSSRQVSAKAILLNLPDPFDFFMHMQLVRNKLYLSPQKKSYLRMMHHCFSIFIMQRHCRILIQHHSYSNLFWSWSLVCRRQFPPCGNDLLELGILPATTQYQRDFGQPFGILCKLYSKELPIHRLLQSEEGIGFSLRCKSIPRHFHEISDAFFEWVSFFDFVLCQLFLFNSQPIQKA